MHQKIACSKEDVNYPPSGKFNISHLSREVWKIIDSKSHFWGGICDRSLEGKIKQELFQRTSRTRPLWFKRFFCFSCRTLLRCLWSILWLMAFSWYQKFWIQTVSHTPQPAQPFPWPSGPRLGHEFLASKPRWHSHDQHSIKTLCGLQKTVRKALGVAGVRRGKRENWKPSLLLGGFNWISTTKPCYLMGVQLPKPQLIFSPDFWTINTIKQSDIWLLVSANPLEKICSSKWVHLPQCLVCENRKIVETATT